MKPDRSALLDEAREDEQPKQPVHLTTRAGLAPTWEPIETAPKDRQILLGRVADLDEEGEPREGVVAQGFWIEGYPDEPDQMGHDDCWTDCNFDVFTYPRSFGAPAYRSAGHQPTHWMPLPPAPSRSQSGALGSNEHDFGSRIEHLLAQVQRQRELLMQAREALAYYKDAERPEDTCGGGYWSLADDGKTAREAIAAIDALEPAEPVKGETL